eukprot:gene15863-10587_t
MDAGIAPFDSPGVGGILGGPVALTPETGCPPPRRAPVLRKVRRPVSKQARRSVHQQDVFFCMRKMATPVGKRARYRVGDAVQFNTFEYGWQGGGMVTKTHHDGSVDLEIELSPHDGDGPVVQRLNLRSDPPVSPPRHAAPVRVAPPAVNNADVAPTEAGLYEALHRQERLLQAQRRDAHDPRAWIQASCPPIILLRELVAIGGEPADVLTNDKGRVQWPVAAWKQHRAKWVEETFRVWIAQPPRLIEDGPGLTFSTSRPGRG